MIALQNIGFFNDVFFAKVTYGRLAVGTI